MYNLSNAYLGGKGVTEDYDEALKWLRLAAESGHPDAQNVLGLMHLEALDDETVFNLLTPVDDEAAFNLRTPEDSKAAFKWIHLAAKQGHPAAQNTLALMYQVGLGVPRDSKKGLRWHDKSLEGEYSQPIIDATTVNAYTKKIAFFHFDLVRMKRKLDRAHEQQ
jgi:TPR repeat protein